VLPVYMVIIVTCAVWEE